MISPFKRNEHGILTFIKTLFKRVIGLCLIIFQIIVYYLIFTEIWNIPYITIVTFFINIIVISYIYNSENNSSFKLSWTIVILLFNLSGSILYLLSGNGKSLPKRKNKKITAYLDQKLLDNDVLSELKDVDDIGYKLALLLHDNTNGYPIYNNTISKYFNDGNEMFLDMLEKIKNARKFIFMEFFIVSEGSLLDEMMELIIDRANSNVEVKFIYDAFGSGSLLSRKYLNKLNNHPNIEIVSYNPFGINLNVSINYRDHRKILIVDGMFAYTGGMNLADEYIHRKTRFGYWRDTGMLIEGRACYSYTLLFAQNWYMSTKQMLLIEDYKPIYEDCYVSGYVFPFGDGPTNRKSPTYDLFYSMISNAQKSIYISTPYFIIDSEFIGAIVRACKCGVNVKILIPATSDKKYLFPVTIAHFKKIIEVGGEVYQYSPGFNHAKNVVIDGKYAYAGTANMDYRSLFLHFECGNLLINTSSIKDMEDDFINVVKESKIMSEVQWKKRPLISKISAFILSIIGPLL